MRHPVAHDAPDTAPGTVSVVVQLTTPARSIQPGSPAGEAFVENFREDLGRADVLSVTTDRVLVHSISASSGGSRVMFYLIEASAAMVRGIHTETQQSAVQLAALFVTLVASTCEVSHPAPCLVANMRSYGVVCPPSSQNTPAWSA